MSAQAMISVTALAIIVNFTGMTMLLYRATPPPPR